MEIAEVEEVNFRHARNYANGLQEIANRLEKLAKITFPEEIDHIMNSWKGENAKILYHKINELQDKLEKDTQKAQKIADSLNEIAQNLYHSEKCRETWIYKIEGR